MKFSLKDKFLHLYNKSIWGLYAYFAILILLIGNLQDDVVGQLVIFSYMYGIVLLVFIVLHTIIILRIFLGKYASLKSPWKTIFWLSIKLLIASLPMFFLDDRFAWLF